MESRSSENYGHKHGTKRNYYKIGSEYIQGVSEIIAQISEWVLHIKTKEKSYKRISGSE